jgi:hypothetical protein
MTNNKKLNMFLFILAILVFLIILVFGCGCSRNMAPSAADCLELYPPMVKDSIVVDSFPVYIVQGAESWKDGFLQAGQPPYLVTNTDTAIWVHPDTSAKIIRVKIPCKTGVRVIQDGALLADYKYLQSNYKELEDRYNKCQAGTKKAPKPKKSGWRFRDWIWLAAVLFLAYQAAKKK